MSEWQIGDLALCIKTPNGHFLATSHPCQKGVTYRVSKIVVASDGSFGVGLEGIAFPYCNLNADHASNYRKIFPDNKPCEEEFTVLIKRGRKVKA